MSIRSNIAPSSLFSTAMMGGIVAAILLSGTMLVSHRTNVELRRWIDEHNIALVNESKDLVLTKIRASLGTLRRKGGSYFLAKGFGETPQDELMGRLVEFFEVESPSDDANKPDWLLIKRLSADANSVIGFHELTPRVGLPGASIQLLIESALSDRTGNEERSKRVYGSGYAPIGEGIVLIETLTIARENIRLGAGQYFGSGELESSVFDATYQYRIQHQPVSLDNVPDEEWAGVYSLRGFISEMFAAQPERVVGSAEPGYGASNRFDLKFKTDDHEFIISLYTPRSFETDVQRAIWASNGVAFGVSFLIIGFTIVVIREARGRQRVTDELTETVRELSRNNAEKDKLLSIIAHDLRAPLTGVTSVAGLLANQPGSITEKELRSYAKQIELTSKGLTETLENLLNWAKLQTGRLHCIYGEVNVELLIRQIVTLFAPVALEKGVVLEHRIQGETDLVADKELLRMILRNLVSNGIRHTDAGGCVTILVEKRNDETCFCVQDTGSGIPEEQLANLFSPVKSQSLDASKRSANAGFGLVLASQVAKKMNGTLSVTSRLNEGSVFTLALIAPEISSKPNALSEAHG